MAKRDLHFRFLYRGIFFLIAVLLCFGRLSGGEVFIISNPISNYNFADFGATATPTAVTCNGGTDGTITISGVTGGSGSFEYSIDNGASYQISPAFSGLTANNNYTVMVRDVNNPSDIQTISNIAVTEPAVLNASVNSDNINCSGANNGSITISAPSGGSGSYEYTINGGTNWSTTTSYTDLSPNTYDVRIRDAANPSCEITLNGSLTITQPAVLNATVNSTNITCNGANDGTITITSPTGGYGTYQYSINGGSSWQNDGLFTGLPPASYNVQIRDAVNTSCQRTLNGSLSITQPSILSATVNSTNITCNDANDGTITITSPTGGYGTYEYSVNGGTSWQAGGAFSGLAPGSYIVQIRDAANPACEITLNSSLTLTQPSEITISTSSITDVSCPGLANGKIVISASGGTGAKTYSISPNVGTQSPAGTFNNLTAQEYTIIATDANNCSKSTVITVNTIPDTTPPTFNIPSTTTIFADNNCNINLLPANTGNVSTLYDICTPAGSLTVAYTDQPVIDGDCETDGFKLRFTRVWTVTDQSGNSTTKNQVISVVDDVPPILYKPDNYSAECGESTHPDNTGWATAVDACGGDVDITYSDATEGNQCAGLIIRTWSATDECGNVTTAVQNIYISDTTPPVVTPIPTTVITNRNLIPPPNASIVVATDNCVLEPAIFFEEVVYGLENKPGYCPDSVRYYYRVADECGNWVLVDQLIVIQDTSPCQRCLDAVPFRVVDFRNNINAVYTFTLERKSRCCVDLDYDDSKDPIHCASFNVVLGDDAVGVQINVDGVTPSGQDWQSGCVDLPRQSNGIYCLDPDKFHLFTYCKSGQGIAQRTNTFTFTAVPGIVASSDVTARVECSTQIEAEAEGIEDIRWNSVWPGTYGQYNKYLSDTVNITDPIFTPDADAPGMIKYEICGYFPGNEGLCFSGSNTCDTITVTVKRDINIEVDINTDMICEDEIPVITPIITPAGTYQLDWYIGTDATGTPDETATQYTPEEQGSYILKVTDMQEGIPCSVAYFPFEINYDKTGPTFQVVPEPLLLQCNDPEANNIILTWLNSASASYTDEDGNVITIKPTHDFTFDKLDMACGSIIQVNFVALDQCSNDSTRTSSITIVDNNPPTWDTDVGDLNQTISCNDSQALIDAQDLEPVPDDDCDDVSTITIVKTPGEFVPSADCANEGTYTNTWTATDECGNTSEVYTQVITIIDETPPTIDCVTPEGDIAEPDICKNEHVLLTPPTFSDLCGTSTLSWVLSGDTNGEGGPELPTIFNVGLTTVTWIVTDACGLTATCEQEVIISDEQDPILTCPSSFSVGADHLQAYASLVAVPIPTHSDNCDYTLTWQITLNGNLVNESTNTTGQSTVPSPYPQLFVGDNIVTYTLTDINGVNYTCSFTITVENEPELDCPESPIPLGTDPGNCTSLYDPDEPILLEGSQPITWVYTITGPDGTVEETVTFIGSEANPGPPQIGPYEFSLGTTRIHWTASNLSGTDECIQTIIVEDNQPPQFTPPDHFEFCVENLFQAVYNGTDLDIEPIPDHYLFKAGSTELNLDMSLFTDNCCLIDTHPYGIRWEIEFSTGETTVSGTGQPSTYGSDIPLWGDGTTYQNVVHTITYWVSDCHNIETGPFVVEITIKPRPQIIKN